MRHYIYLLVSVFLLTLGLTGSTQAMDSVTWMEANAPPFFILEGDQKGQGYEDVVTDILKENLPEYTHKEIAANLSRHIYSFKAEEKVCNVGLFKTPEREEFLYFSTPSFFTLPTVLVIKKKDYTTFGGSKEILLDNLLKEGKVTLGRAAGRSYGKHVDEVLDRYKGKDTLFVFEGDSLSRNFFKMLQKGRLDGLIALPEEALYLAELLNFRDEIMTLTIKENQLSYQSWISYVGCSKTEWGKEIIEKINQVLLAQRPTNRYRAAYERWLDESSLTGYRRLYETVFLEAGK